MKKICLLFVLLCNALNLNAQNFNQLDELLTVLETNNKLMGAMTITKGGVEVYNKAVGYADVDGKIKNATETKFRIGSITKAFTAVMIFQLVDEGKLTLGTPLSQFYPKIPNASNITIAQMLSHSSGLFNITNDPKFGDWMLEKSTKQQMLSRIKAYELDFTPGEDIAYSNTNYLLLGYIAEDLDKKNYAEILKARITDKIGLKSTYYGGKIDVESNESQSYTIALNYWLKQQETDMSNPGGAGAIVSTSKDLTQFMNALFTGKLMSTSSFEDMKKTDNNDVCHGLFYANVNGLDVYASEGGIDGFQSVLVHIPDMQTTIALVANGLDYRKIDIMMSAFRVSAGQPITIPVFTEIELTEQQVEQYEGEYASEEVEYKLIFKANGTILMGAPEQSNLKELTPTKQHQFTFDTLGIVLDFYPGIGAVKFTKGDDKPIMFKKQ
ncbi:serine hydrolase domain-containing protein [Winogradskyella flava]|uniref:Beta-lactamase family protein n=1 Tax=Winogradskyella flava TaxID=1884876 RepID=A0A842IU13_9FLAO|nr:serine hydrolase domain-containing protein [Winogradskyella flava]MBC2845374.1 beta-lactamase family protein [Winogradskyella flava]